MKRFVLVVAAVFATVTLVFSFSASKDQVIQKTSNPDAWLTHYIEPPRDVSSSSVYTFLCESITQKPETLTNTCADFGESVYKIKWKTWGITGATGTGIYSINNCEPNCAEGKRNEVPVQLKLDRLTTDGKRYVLNVLTIISDNATEPGGVYALWDLSDFYREVPDMRSN